MKYSDFDYKFNKRKCGKVEKCSIIDEEGTVYAYGTVCEMNAWWDTHTIPIWKDGKYNGCEIDGKKVMMTNVGESLFKTIEPYLRFSLV